MSGINDNNFLHELFINEVKNAGGGSSGGSGGGVSSWNDLTDKPFGESATGGDTLTWDGNTDGKIGVPELGVYLVSNKPFSSNDVENGMKVTVYYKSHNAEQSYELRDYEIYINPDGFITTEGVFSVPYDNYVATDLGGIVFPSTGIYVINTGDIYVSSITIPGYTGFPAIKKLDAKYLPDIDKLATKEYVSELLGVIENGTY